MSDHAAAIAARVENFVREIVIPYESDPRIKTHRHGPSEELVLELRAKAKSAGVLTPHILPDGSHLSQRDTSIVLRKSGLSPLVPVAVHTMAPDEGNMRSDEHTSELQSLMRISYAVFSLTKKT